MTLPSAQDARWFARVTTNSRNWVMCWQQARDKNGCPGRRKDDPQVRVWVKPRKRARWVPAREKLAADLGYMLGLPVASVLLTMGRPPGRRRRQPLALSKFADAPYLAKLSDVKKSGPPELMQQVERWFDANPHQLAGIWVLDTWLKNKDRTLRNIMVAYDDDGLREVYFFDFDISQRWHCRISRSPVRRVRTPLAISRRVTREQINWWIRRINRIRPPVLKYLIYRLPRPYLSRHRKKYIYLNLLRRRRFLAAVFKSVGG